MLGNFFFYINYPLTSQTPLKKLKKIKSIEK